ncbi:hypothetical protein Pyn_20280 [Prunus yedoensis var. nudiflora]|uniref:Uncharacterized protein n=1 Tax=Prunus yedoensis var. nudiflora TaxID=2094558 RepID=A0A314Y7H5_PRUYE|nr:hypothetical protein Pyn_20280 [Prunus yedoensis var. nudiflora]
MTVKVKCVRNLAKEFHKGEVSAFEQCDEEEAYEQYDETIVVEHISDEENDEEFDHEFVDSAYDQSDKDERLLKNDDKAFESHVDHNVADIDPNAFEGEKEGSEEKKCIVDMYNTIHHFIRCFVSHFPICFK